MADLWQEFLREFTIILTDGGWLMIPLTILAIAIYWTAFRMLFYFSEHRFYKVQRHELFESVENPGKVSGELRMILDYTQGPETRSTDDVHNRFAEVNNAYLSDVNTKRTYLLTLVTTAPLTGLLGTVMGMLTTFSGLAISSGKTVDQIADGISEALITTQTGLIIAIPAYVLLTLINKRRNEMESFLTVLEAMTVQIFEKKHKDKGLSS